MNSRTVLETFLGVLLAVLLIPARGETNTVPSMSRNLDVKEGASEAVVTASASFEKQGRTRDPFRDQIPQKQAGASASVVYPPGKRGLVINQLKLMGIARAANGDWIAVVDNNTHRVYFLRNGDRLFNGTVAKVLVDRVIFTETMAELPGRSDSREVVKRMAAE